MSRSDRLVIEFFVVVVVVSLLDIHILIFSFSFTNIKEQLFCLEQFLGFMQLEVKSLFLLQLQ